MKLISCHIENFGKLHDFSYEFDDGVNIICKENGWGKSTFAAFLRAMFYGLEGEKKRKILENERKRYQPWQGGVFGGKLVFETGERQYEISRIFYDKESRDIFELRDVATNLVSEDYSKKIGEELFGIDRASFLRTVFIDQNGCETSATDDINAKIGNLADGTDDIGNFDSANAKLTKIINALTPARLPGALAKRREEIARCEWALKEGGNIPASMEVYRQRILSRQEAYEELKKQLKEAGTLQERASRIQSTLARKDEWERRKNEVLEREGECLAAAAYFPGKIPAPAQVKEAVLHCGELGRAYERLSLYRLNKEEEAEFCQLKTAFADGVPDEAEFEIKREEAGRLARKQQEYEAGRMSRAERERYEELAPYFSQEEESAAMVMADWARRNQKKAAMPSNQAALKALTAVAASGTGGGKYDTALFIAGILLMAVGIVVAAMVFPAAGIALAVAGFLVTAFAIWKKVGKQVQDAGDTPETGNLKRLLAEDTAWIERVDGQTMHFLHSHGREMDVQDEEGITLALQEIMLEAAEYEALDKKVQSAKESSLASEVKSLKDRMDAFLARYEVILPSLSHGQEGRTQAYYADMLYTIKERSAAYLRFLEKQERRRMAKEEYEQVRAKIAAFYEEYSLAAEENISLQLNEIRDAAGAYEDAAKAYGRATDELRQFEEENDVSLFEDGGGEENIPSLAEIHGTILSLNGELEQMREELAQDEKALKALQEQYEAWEENRVKLQQLKEIQQEEQKKYDLVFLAREKLTAAKEAMTAKYATPLLKSFSSYCGLLTKMPALRFYMDANTAVTVEESGKQREAEAFSRGWRDLIGLCLRLALADAMYRKEKTILVMDDPFTNLDDGKIAASRDFLQEVAKKYQIIYFTCSGARG